jgi:TetR/AcrR family transcriptional repressor of nem operon
MQEYNITAEKILDVAELYIQTRGFNDFSYRDIQNQVGVKTSSIHYYFPTKNDLIVKLIDRYAYRFDDYLNTIVNTQAEGAQRVDTIGGVYSSLLRDGKFCMYGMLASDTLTLSDEVNQKVCAFFDSLEAWLAEAIRLAQDQGVFKVELNAKKSAALLLGSFEGAMLIARAKKSPEYLDRVIEEAISQLKV